MSIDLLWQANVDCYLTTIEVMTKGGQSGIRSR